MRKVIIAAALLGVLVSGPVWAVDEAGSYFNFGAGLEKCTKYLGEYAAADLKKIPGKQISYKRKFGYILGWIEGYATRVNKITKAGADIYDMSILDMMAWLASWCRDNPSKILINAMDSLTENQLHARMLEEVKRQRSKNKK